MAQLAIKGHATRGREVIELLEMLGGKNNQELHGDRKDLYYFINSDCYGTIDSSNKLGLPCAIFTLEEFLEKFPYKVGDKVLYKLYNVYSSIRKMTWNEEKEQVIYRLDSQKIWVATTDELQPYKEETMEEKLESNEGMFLKLDTSSMKVRQIIFGTNSPSETELVLGDNFEIKVDDGKTYVVRKKPQYPKTYEECCKVLNLTKYPPALAPNKSMFISQYKDFPHYYEIGKFAELLICRDAYWKIAGEQMGLGKAWEPDYEIDEDGIGTVKFCIKNMRDHIKCIETSESNTILAFPSAEMRDAFYENFKDLIEECKELL